MASKCMILSNFVTKQLLTEHILYDLPINGSGIPVLTDLDDMSQTQNMTPHRFNVGHFELQITALRGKI